MTKVSKKYQRTVFKSGNSLVIAIPAKLCKSLNISENDILSIFENAKKINLERIVLNE
jgi:antitoxin component of MazEF toxin-antitoxin module